MTNKQCPDCKGELTPITLFGRGWENPITKLAIDADLSFYAENDAERGDFTGMFNPKGHVESFICNSCGRVFLYGSVK